MAQWAYRTGSAVSAGGAVGDALAVSKPTGTAAGDLIVVLCYWEPDTITITPPSGFQPDVASVNPGDFMGQVFSKIAGGGEPSTYTFTPSSNGHFRTIVAAAYSGGTGTAPVVDVTSTNFGDSVLAPAQTAPSVTTTGVNRLLVFGFGGFNVGATGATGAAPNTRIAAGGALLSDGAFAAAGATGATQATGAGTETFWSMHVAYISDPPVSGDVPWVAPVYHQAAGMTTRVVSSGLNPPER